MCKNILKNSFKVIFEGGQNFDFLVIWAFSLNKMLKYLFRMQKNSEDLKILKVISFYSNKMMKVIGLKLWWPLSGIM